MGNKREEGVKVSGARVLKTRELADMTPEKHICIEWMKTENANCVQQQQQQQNHLAICSEDKAPYLQSRVMLPHTNKNPFFKTHRHVRAATAATTS